MSPHSINTVGLKKNKSTTVNHAMLKREILNFFGKNDFRFHICDIMKHINHNQNWWQIES